MEEARMTCTESSKDLMHPRLKINRVSTGDHALAMRRNVLEPIDAAKSGVEIKLCNFRASFIEDLSAFCL